MIHLFWDELRRLEGTPCRLLECGSRRQPGQPRGEAQNARLHREDVLVTGLDAEPGEGVDVVADLHNVRWSGIVPAQFDAVLVCSTLEHVRRPWVVAKELARITHPGGVLYCQTHQTMCLHGYPNDYFRFSADALAEIFCEDAGWLPLFRGHEFPCKVLPLTNEWAHARDWNFLGEAYLNSWILARRV